MVKIGKYVLMDILRNKFVPAYCGLLLVVTLGMFSLDGDGGKTTLNLLNIILLVVPLVSVVFTTIQFFNSYEFIELLLAQPVNRRTIFLSEFLAVAFALGAALLVGVGLPVLLHEISVASLTLIASGLVLTFVFVAIAFMASVFTRDKAKAIGIALLFWIYFTLIYDALILYVVYAYSDYPLEKVTLALVSANPVDLARVLILLQLDVSALMGYTGAFYQEFFGSSTGMIYSFAALLLWIAAPFLLALRKFSTKDI